MNVAKAIDTIYNEREQFIIIGLTGRTGSGCTTVSEILQAEEFSDLKMREPKTTNFSNINERKYQIIHSYAQSHWHAFTRISMTDMIFSFVLHYDYTSFMNILTDMFGESIVNEIKRNINIKYNSLEMEFNILNQSVLECLGENGNLMRKDSCDLDNEYEILIRLPSVQTKFREIMQELNYSYENQNNETEKANVFTFCLQEFGNRIRHLGNIEK